MCPCPDRGSVSAAEGEPHSFGDSVLELRHKGGSLIDGKRVHSESSQINVLCGSLTRALHLVSLATL